MYLPRAADAVATATATYTLPLLVLSTTDSPALTGTAFTVEWVPRLASFGRAGALVSRHGAGRVMRCAAAARAGLLLAAIPLLTAGQARTGVVTTATVMALAALVGVLSQFSYLAAETAGAAASRRAERPHRVQSVLLAIDQGAMLAGPAAGGILLQQTGPGGLLAVVAVMSAAAAATAPGARAAPVGVPGSAPDHRPSPSATGSRPAARAGWATLRSLPALAWLVAGLAVSNLATGTVQAAAPVIVVTNLGRSSASVGAVWSLAAAATLLVVAGSRPAIDRWGLWRVGGAAATAASLACLAVAAVAQTRHFPAFMILIAVLMAAETGMTVVLRTARSQLIPPDAFAPTLAATIVVLLLPFPLAGVLVACTPPDALGQVLTGLAVAQAAALAAAFTKVRAALTPRAVAAASG
ncbi:MFS transporter [Actinacidiphila sp. DG2A-62]|nr:MFS transporter [Actinacidiphila sp. DG2A-62]MEC3997182.1 MFS transporter [Actinacidiphila sp. DG2A-62]